jgi:hypothetical protein
VQVPLIPLWAQGPVLDRVGAGHIDIEHLHLLFSRQRVSQILACRSRGNTQCGSDDEPKHSLKPREVEDVLCVFKDRFGAGAWCASELVWMTLGLTSRFFPRAHTALKVEDRDLVRDLICDSYFA